MGKTRGHGSRPKRGRGGRRGGGAGGGGGRGEEEESSEEEVYEPVRGVGAQSSTVGMLPPSDSDDEGDKAKGDGPAAKPKQPQAKPAGQSKNAGKLPPSGSSSEESDSEDDESDESSDEPPLPEYLTQPSAPRKKKDAEEIDPEQIARDIARLELIKNKREQDRLKRIADEGWDRFAPVSDTNKPPGHVPSDHPSQAKS